MAEWTAKDFGKMVTARIAAVYDNQLNRLHRLELRDSLMPQQQTEREEILRLETQRPPIANTSGKRITNALTFGGFALGAVGGVCLATAAAPVVATVTLFGAAIALAAGQTRSFVASRYERKISKQRNAANVAVRAIAKESQGVELSKRDMSMSTTQVREAITVSATALAGRLGGSWPEAAATWLDSEDAIGRDAFLKDLRHETVDLAREGIRLFDSDDHGLDAITIAGSSGTTGVC